MPVASLERRLNRLTINGASNRVYNFTTHAKRFKQIALFGWLPWLTADLGCLFGPTIAWWLQKRGVSLVNGRRWAFRIAYLYRHISATFGAPAE